MRWIEEIGEYVVFTDWTVSGWDYGNSRSAGADFLQVRQPWNNGLHGERILLGSIDTGVDFDHLYMAAPAQPAVAQENPPTQACPGGGPANSLKVPYYHLGPAAQGLIPACYDQPSASSDPSLLGHGSATSGLMCADHTAADNTTIDLSSGTAPEAQLWMYDVGPATGPSLALEPAEVSEELGRMAGAGASAVNLSFGDPGADGAYDLLAEIFDTAAWENPAFLPVQASGNDGADAGTKSTGSMDSTGKNVLTVGGNLDSVPNDLYSFSSRGPTDDNRYKPDVISPAVNPLHSADPDPDLDERFLLLASDGNIGSHNSALFEGPEGTSFSCASVTGLAGIVAQYFKDGFYPTGSAMSADSLAAGNELIKGMIINSGLRMTGASVANDARPGKDQGWGRVKLNDPLYFSADPSTGQDARRLVVFTGGFAQGSTACPADSEIFRFNLFNVEEDLRVTLAWTDYPGDHNSPQGIQLVNDLDLIVTAPTGTVYRGNVFDANGTGYSTAGGSSDRLNNVENVWVAAGENLPTGTWTVEVCPFGVNAGARQGFSLVVTGGVRAGEKVQFDQAGYSCSDTVGIAVLDLTGPGPSVQVVLTGAISGDHETLTLPLSTRTGTYDGSIETAPVSGTPVSGNGILEVADGETIHAAYRSSTDLASIECSPEVCYAVDVGSVLGHECDQDGFPDNTETIYLYVPIRNSEGFPVDGVTATLTSNNSHVTVVSGTAHYGIIPPGGVATPDADGTDDPFVISVSGAACDEPATLTIGQIHGDGWSSAGCQGGAIALRLNRDPFPMENWDFDDGSSQAWTHAMVHGSTPTRECTASYLDAWNTFPTTTRSQSGSFAMQLGNGSYQTMLDAALISPALDVPSGGARLRFYYWMDADIYDAAQVWHGFIVEAKPDAGGTWTQLTPVGGYNAFAGRNDCLYIFPFAKTQPSWLQMFGGDGVGTIYTGDTFDREWVVDLSSYASQRIRVRFRFGSDSYPSSAEGLYIDTITLEGFQCETPQVCDDANPCTTEYCNAAAGGCIYTPLQNGTPCNDGQACTTSDHCAGGVCTGTFVISCKDGNVCTDDWAEDDGDGVCNNPALDCHHRNNTAPCDDASFCTAEDICSGGLCRGPVAVDCDDHKTCTNDSCNPSSGCVHAPNTVLCNDGFACTLGDVCSGGLCAGTPNQALCNDEDTCTNDACSPGVPGAGLDGCIHASVPNGTACNDSNVCTLTESCQGGVCAGQQFRNCVDGASCTLDLCDAVLGCSNPGIDIDTDGYDICGTGDPVNPDGLARDCDDANLNVNPGQPEDCFNYVDDDCNNLIDADDTLGCPRSDISGIATYYRTAGGSEPGTNRVASVEMNMVGTSLGTTNTSSSGYYQFLDIIKGFVSITPRKAGGFAQAISSLDAARISQYRVGLYTFTPNQLIAADTSGNGSISSYDAALVSQLRVGIINRFPVSVAKNSDFAFVPAQRNYALIMTDQPDQGYLAAVYGDVTGNWATSGILAAASAGEPEEEAAAEPPGLGATLAAEPGTEVASSAAVRVLKRAPEAKGPEARESGREWSGEAGSGQCRLWLQRQSRRGLPRGQAGYALMAQGCDGLLGLDLDIRYAPAAVKVLAVGRGSRTSSFEVVAGEAGGVLKVSMFGSEPVADDGSLLEIIVVVGGVDRNPWLSFDAVGNEGQIEIVKGRPRRSAHAGAEAP